MGNVVSLDEFGRRGQNTDGGRDSSRNNGHQTPASADLRGPFDTGQVFFHRRELSRILNVYGQMVAAGECRDYAIGADKDSCTFAIFIRASEAPAWRIVKRPKLSRKQGAWQVYNREGLILKRGHDLDTVLRVFDRKRFSTSRD